MCTSKVGLRFFPSGIHATVCASHVSHKNDGLKLGNQRKHFCTLRVTQKTKMFERNYSTGFPHVDVDLVICICAHAGHCLSFSLNVQLVKSLAWMLPSRRAASCSGQKFLYGGGGVTKLIIFSGRLVFFVRKTVCLAVEACFGMTSIRSCTLMILLQVWPIGVRRTRTVPLFSYWQKFHFHLLKVAAPAKNKCCLCRHCDEYNF